MPETCGMTEQPSRLSGIDTLWSVVRRAHADSTVVVQTAQEQLLARYGGAVQRYLLASLRNEDAASEAYQEFALRFVRGDFRNADPGRGRFRDFVKTCLRHLIADHHRARARTGHELPADAPDLSAEDMAIDDAEFQQRWREELLDRSWAALQAEEQSSGNPYYTALRFRVGHPELKSAELAQGLSSDLGRELSSGAVRMTLFRARQLFAEMLLDEIRNSLDQPTMEDIEQELLDLQLHDYCREALERRRTS
jgi:RNA polymerase sigma-70 factor (ECF subfamily)